MKHFVATPLAALVFGLLIVVSATAQDGPKKALVQAEKLEAKAEKLLDQGKRAEAFNLLARAADLREKDRANKSRKTPTAKKTKKPAPKKAGSQKAESRKPATVAQAHARLDRALAKGDVKAAKAASKALRNAHKRAHNQLEGRLAGAEKQLGLLERRLIELQKLIQR